MKKRFYRRRRRRIRQWSSFLQLHRRVISQIEINTENVSTVPSKDKIEKKSHVSTVVNEKLLSIDHTEDEKKSLLVIQKDEKLLCIDRT